LERFDSQRDRILLFHALDFKSFNFYNDLAEGLESMGYSTPTPIQAETIPLLQQKHDLIACAQTGTGKTAAYLLPVMDAICRMESRPAISALILAPTRELAVQIDQQVEGLGYFTGLSSIAIYGGGDGIGYEQQRRALREGVDIVVATPGRLIAHMSSGTVKFEGVRLLVLDEADRMLDMGFKDDINRIVRELPADRQTMMFSATMPPKIRAFAKTLLKNPKQVNIAISQPAEKIRQLQYKVSDGQKIALLKQILAEGDYKSVIVFSSTKEKVKSAHRELKKMGLGIQPFHSDLGQDEREKLLLEFKNKQLQILIGTDVLSRGIDVDGIDLVVNFDVPPDPEDYIHRIGRTARAERTGTAITFVNSRDARRFQQIEQLMDRRVEVIPLPEGFDASVDDGRTLSRTSERRRGRGRDGGRNRSRRREGDRVKEPNSTGATPAGNGLVDSSSSQPASQSSQSASQKKRANRNRQRNRKQNRQKAQSRGVIEGSARENLNPEVAISSRKQ